MNKKNIKSVIIYGFITFAVIFAVIGLYNYARSLKVADGTISYDVYYISASEKILGTEQRLVNYVDDEKTMFNTIVEEFSKGPSSTSQRLLLPPEFNIKGKRFSDKTAYIDLEESYNDMQNNYKIMSISALVYTLTEMSFIDGVEITVDGEPLFSEYGDKPMLLNRQNIRNNPKINPEKTQWQTVTLYFTDHSGSRIASEKRSIQVKNSLTLEYQIVEQLILGPDKNMLNATIPPDTEIRNIKTEDGICYVNLSDDFIDDNVAGVDSQLVTIYSVVNSLTELDYVNKVQFLIDGEKVNKISDNIDFSKPFSRNTDILKVIQ